MWSTLLHEGVIKLSTTKVYVFSDSVHCVGGRIAEFSHSVQSGKNRIEWFTQFNLYVRVEDFPRAHYADASPGSPKHDGEKQHSARKFQGSNHLHVDVQRH